MVARPDLRPIVLVGDGAFQMTGMELSSVVRYGFQPIVIVLDNRGYGTERWLHAGDHAFNDVQPWHYHKLPEILGGGTGYEVRSEGEFDRALRQALADRSGFSLIHVHLDPHDASQALERLGKAVECEGVKPRPPRLRSARTELYLSGSPYPRFLRTSCHACLNPYHGAKVA